MKSSHHFAILTAASLFALASAPVHAAESAPADTVADADNDEIIVTAQRREQNVQNVPIAIQAFSGAALAKIGISSTEELARRIPGATIFDTRGAGQPAWVIRGVGLADFNSNNTPTAAIHYDDFYLTSNVMGGVATFDLDRIEVLKGPQGGLYGRNTTGGAVAINSRRPDFSGLNGYALGSFGRWNQWRAEGAIGAPLSDTVAVRLAGQVNKGGGWQDSLNTPQDDRWGDKDKWALRGQVLFQPSSTASFLFKVETGQDRSETTLGQAMGIYDAATGNYCAGIAAGRQDDPSCIAFFNLTNEFVLSPTGALGTLPTAQDAHGYHVLANPINRLDNDWLSLSLRGELDLGSAQLQSISNWMRYRNIQYYDYDASPLKLFEEQPGDARITSWSQELRLISSHDGPLTWLTGALYAKDRIIERRDGRLDDNWLALGQVFPPPFVNTRSFSQYTRSWSVYGQMGYDLGDRFNLNGSLRYTDEDRELVGYSHYIGLPGSGFYIVQNVNHDYALGAHWSGHVGLDWKPDPRTLVYLKATRGYKSGGFFGGFAMSAGELDPYREETVWSYELGFKSQPAKGLTFNGAAYYYDYSNVQGYLTVYNSLLNQALTKLGNIGDARHIGAEAELAWKPVRGLTVQASAAYIDAKINKSSSVTITEDGQTVSFKGLQRTFAPEFSYSLLGRYETTLAGLDASLQFAWDWRSALVTRASQGSAIDYGLYRHDGFGIGQVRAAMGNSQAGWELALLVDNVFDKAYALRVTNDDLGSSSRLPGRPRSWSIEASYKF